VLFRSPLDADTSARLLKFLKRFLAKCDTCTTEAKLQWLRGAEQVTNEQIH
jgi:hypothetical protein